MVAAAAMAGASGAGTAMLILLLVLSRRSSEKEDRSGLKLDRQGRAWTGRSPVHPPSTWGESVLTLVDTLRFAYAETLGKWPIADLVFGINYLSKRQGNQVASVFAGSNSVQLKGAEIVAELVHLLRLLNLCMLLSKKPFPLFLEYGGYSQEDVLLHKPKAGHLKPPFTILRDRSSKCFLLIIRGMHSIKDTLTAATGAVVPFHYLVLHEGGISKVVLGYAHCGMVAAARWISKCATSCLLKAVSEHPAYSIKIVGNSLGGGIASLLTYILREHVEFSSSTCISFAPAACVTWDLAESGNGFITTIINNSDLVPSCSIASLDNLRSEVTASSWFSDIWDQIQCVRFLNKVHRSLLAVRSHIPSGAETVCSKAQVMIKNAQTAAHVVVRTSFSLASWSCISAHQRATRKTTSPQVCSPAETAAEELSCSSFRDRNKRVTAEELVQIAQVTHGSSEQAKAEGELRFELERDVGTTVRVGEEETAYPTAPATLQRHHFFPAGRIMHMVAVPTLINHDDGSITTEQSVDIYKTPRELYGKIRLSPAMIKDHYMPSCKKMMELLIDQLKRDLDVCPTM